MNPRSQLTAHKRALGTIAIVAALLISVLSMGDADSFEPLVLALILVLTGIGLRIEVAINESRV